MELSFAADTELSFAQKKNRKIINFSFAKCQILIPKNFEFSFAKKCRTFSLQKMSHIIVAKNAVFLVYCPIFARIMCFPANFVLTIRE
jgi:hypothetical protein